ncbi:LamG domain-containing protein [Hanamia caeni]|jgi:hypothetical protein|nr:LamG domain-containing protein [Hanamia caeni]
MNIIKKYKIQLFLCSLAGMALVSSCKKGNPNNLPSVSPKDFVGKIEGFDSSGQVATDHLVAYWGFNGSQAEEKSGIAPTSSLNATLVDNGVAGKALQLDSGYVYYASQIPAFKDSLPSFTVSEWVQIQNNGSTPTMTFSLAAPGQFWPDFAFLLETGQKPASDTNNLVVHPSYADVNGGRQDNLNAGWLTSYKSPTIPPGKWTHLVVTFDHASSIFQIWANGVKIGAPDYQNRGTGLFKLAVPNEVLIGGWYNNIPGKELTTDTWTVPMRGKIDEIRVYNEALGAADIIALYKLGRAGQ